MRGPAGKPSAKRLGSFLVQSQFQGSVNSSAMFLTGAAQNLLCLKLATELGVVIASPWLTWFKAAVVPALTGLMLTPLLLYKVSLGGPSFIIPNECQSTDCGLLRLRELRLARRQSHSAAFILHV